ncbi:MAG TPA: tetratricopeptide repeat protein [Candidatus Eisenbacteria bacterium]|nr:tetratricopeptide repeat protein [Candidatus Eisenbacteria bacterium]
MNRIVRRSPRDGIAPVLVRALALFAVATTGMGAFYEWGGAAYRGMRDLKERRYREAAEAFREARREHPRSAAVRYDEALAVQGAGAADSAAAMYEETYRSQDLEGDPARAAAAYNRGNMAMRDRQFDEARTHYMESLRLDPSRTDAKKNLEEAIRRIREAPPTPSSGGSGGGPPPPGGGQGAAQPPPPGGEKPPPPGEQPPQGSQSSPDMGGTAPSRSEAEHWLDALEAERKAARQREREPTSEESRSRDW